LYWPSGEVPAVLTEHIASWLRTWDAATRKATDRRAEVAILSDCVAVK